MFKAQFCAFGDKQIEEWIILTCSCGSMDNCMTDHGPQVPPLSFDLLLNKVMLHAFFSVPILNHERLSLTWLSHL